MVEKHKRPLILTCSLCSNFHPNRGVCKLNDESRLAFSSDYASGCNERGDFIRYLQIIPDLYNYYSLSDDPPHLWEQDFSKVAKDAEGKPLVVRTKRGLERAIPANESVALRAIGTVKPRVNPIFTFQGQREIIYELGVNLATREAQKHGVELRVLPEEEGWEGLLDKVNQYVSQEALEASRVRVSLLSDEPVKEW